METTSIFNKLAKLVTDYAKPSSILGSILGGAVLIWYCSTINFFPSGLTLADTLIFIWLLVIFGLYYSAIVYAFFAVSQFWVSLLSIPLNKLFRKKLKDNNLQIPAPESKYNWFEICFVGILTNTLVFGILLYQNRPIFNVICAILLMGFFYVLVQNIPKINYGSKKTSDWSREPIGKQPDKPELVKLIFCLVIYLIPMVIAHIGGDIAKKSLETMGVRQLDVTISIQRKEYQPLLQSHYYDGLLSNLECHEVCNIKNVDILFSNIGSNAKIRVSGEKGSAMLVIPNSSIKATSKEM